MMSRFVEFVRRSFGEFLATPTIVIVGFLAFTGLMLWLDRSDAGVLPHISRAMSWLVFNDPDATRTLLSTLAGGLVTLTSITFSLLLLALQQAATSMTHSIIDQFLRRRSNQVFFGFFVGLALYALIVLSATGAAFNPVLSGTVALLLAGIALFLLIVLIYSTIHQVRPAVVVEAIHDLALTARERQNETLARTRRTALRTDTPQSVTTDEDGFVVHVDIDALDRVLGEHADAELDVRAPIGTYVAHGETVVDVRGLTLDEDGQRAVLSAFVLERVRDVSADPSFAIEELVNIAWTSMSSSKQNPAPGSLVILSLRDLLFRWSGVASGQDRTEDPARRTSVVYADTLVHDAIAALELLAVVCSESKQTQNAATLIETLARVYARGTADTKDRVADVAMRILGTLDDHVMIAQLGTAVGNLADSLASTHPAAAVAVRRTLGRVTSSNGSR